LDGLTLLKRGLTPFLLAEQMLNRSDGVVTDVWIAGSPAWQNSKPTKHLGATHLGSALTVHPSSNYPFDKGV
jgi:hypothetical protein